MVEEEDGRKARQENLLMHGVCRTAVEALACKHSAQRQTVIGTKRKSPLLNRVYLMRSAIIHRLVECSFASMPPGRFQFVSLGGGLDISYDRLAEDCGAAHFVVDLPEVISARAEMYTKATTTPSMGHENSNSSIGGDAPKCLAGDLTDMNCVWQSLLAAGLRADQPIVVLIECVLCYLPLTTHHHILSFLAMVVHAQSVMICYDPCLPDTPSSSRVFAYSSHMRDRFLTRKAPLRGTHVDISDQLRALYASHWLHAFSMTINQAWRLLFSAEKREQLVLEQSRGDAFDELNSLLLLNSLYCVSIGTKDAMLFNQLWRRVVSGGGSSGSVDITVRTAIAQNRVQALQFLADEKKKEKEKEMKFVSAIESTGQSNDKVFIRESTALDADVVSCIYKEVSRD
jgi:hypothetical protein